MSTEKTVVCGIVLRQTDTKESDKILTVLTAEQGKIRVIARGARRKNSRVTAVCQLLAYSELTLYRRRDWYYLDEGNTLALFTGLQQDLERLSLAMYLAEVTETLTQEEIPAEEPLSLLLNALYALDTLKKPPELVKAVFELRALCLGGYEPLVGECPICGREEPKEAVFDLAGGMLRCLRCGGRGESLPLDPSAVQAVRRAVYGDPKRLYSFSLSGVAMEQFSLLAETFLVRQLERDFGTLRFYRSLKTPLL